MLQGWQYKVVTILVFHDCMGLVGTTLQPVSRVHYSSSYITVYLSSKLVYFNTLSFNKWFQLSTTFFIQTRRTKSIIIAQKSILKLVKLQSFCLRNVVKYGKYSPVKLANLSRKWCIFPRVILKYSKFANFTRLYFPYFTTFRNHETLQFY
jgi:hypothetical protein